MVDTANEWQSRPLKKFYTFLFVDCLYASIRREMETKNCAVYVILGYDVDGAKDILGIISEQEYRKLGCDERKRMLYQGSAVKCT